MSKELITAEQAAEIQNIRAQFDEIRVKVASIEDKTVRRLFKAVLVPLGFLMDYAISKKMKGDKFHVRGASHE